MGLAVVYKSRQEVPEVPDQAICAFRCGRRLSWVEDAPWSCSIGM